jgi:ketosteroid isomerase-like protein
MSQESLELIRRLYAGGPAVERLLREGGDLTEHPWLALWHPECVLEDLADAPGAAVYHGREGVVEYLERSLQEIWEEWQFTPTELIDRGEAVFAAVRNRGRSKAGIELEMQMFQACRIRDGMVAVAAGFLDREQALDAAGISR